LSTNPYQNLTMYTTSSFGLIKTYSFNKNSSIKIDSQLYK